MVKRKVKQRKLTFDDLMRNTLTRAMKKREYEKILQVVIGKEVDSEEYYKQYYSSLYKSAEFDHTTATESIVNTLTTVLSVVAIGAGLTVISGGLFGFAVPGYIATAGQVAGGMLTAKDIGHLITGKDINGNPLSATDKEALMGSFILDATMVGVSSLNKLKLKYVSKANKVDGIEGVSKPTIKYEYNMIENPVPLVKIDGQPASNFYAGKYNIEVLPEDRIYYRAGQDGKPLGQWFTSEPAESVAKVRIDTAVKEQWIDRITGEITGTSIIDTNYAIKIPKGTTVYTDPVGYQGGVYLGGYDMMQTFIQEPWKLNVEVISKRPLK